MISSQTVLEREALDELERRLSDRGYQFTRQPGASDLPEFLGSFQPDAIATGKEPSLLVEVITRRGSGEVEVKKIEQLQRLLRDHPNWKLEVVYTTPSSPLPTVASVDAIRDRFLEVRHHLASTDRRAALILAWSLLEAIARAILPGRAARGLTPASTIEVLTSLGYVSQSEAIMLREAGSERNLIVHGDVTVDVSAEQLAAVFDIVDALIRQIEDLQSV